MFSYYGSKSKIIHYYPYPQYEWVIEPFAGSARYACLNYLRKVWINDKYDVIYKIWKWIQQASWKDIESLPEPEAGDCVHDLGLKDEPLLLMQMIAACGVQYPRNFFTARAVGIHPDRTADRTVYTISTVASFKKGIRPLIGRIDHWRITNIDYEELPNIKATWFIDPPYEKGGQSYKVNDVDYCKLLRWIKSRRGETITCENGSNTWLDWHEPLVRVHGSLHNTMEVIRHEMDV